MEQQNQTNTEKPKKTYWKFVLWFLGIIIGVFVLYDISFWGWQFFKQYQGEKAVQKLAEELERIKKEDYEKAIADTYGGKTPQETLQMYIDAVEKGDYELASKYFILDKQGKELESLKNSNKENIENVLKLLKQTIKSSGSFSTDQKGYIIRKPLLVDFLLYPNDIWKIIEI